MESVEDSELIARILEGDRRAFAVLVHRHSRRVYARIARSVRSADDIEDLVQDVFVKVYERLDQLRDHNRFRAWLNQLVRNAVYSWHRRRTIQLRLEDALYQELDTGEVSDAEIVGVVRMALRALSAEHRQVIAHHYFKGYSYAETAVLLDLTEEAVRGRLKRARLKLKEELLVMTDVLEQTLALNQEDMDALVNVGGFVSNDEKRPVLQGICLDTGGRIVGTNGHVLIMRTSQRLEGLSAPIILGPWKEINLVADRGGTLAIGDGAVQIQVEGGDDYEIPLIEGPFVQYETVIPQEDPVATLTFKTDLLANALHLLEDHMEARHPESDGWHYKSQVEMHLSPLAQTVTFLTSRDMGYTRSKEDGTLQSFTNSQEVVSPGGPVDWIFHVPIEVNFDISTCDETQRLAVSFAYFKQVLNALEFEACDEIVMEYRGAGRAMLFRPSRNEDWLALLMPLRLEALKPAE